MTVSDKSFVEWDPIFDAEGEANVAAYQREFAQAGMVFRAVREMLELTQMDAAKLLHTTQANISKMEKRTSLDLNQVRTLAAGKHFKMSLILRSEEREVEIAV